MVSRGWIWGIFEGKATGLVEGLDLKHEKDIDQRQGLDFLPEPQSARKCPLLRWGHQGQDRVWGGNPELTDKVNSTTTGKHDQGRGRERRNVSGYHQYTGTV